ncbi:MAG: hypothetical protein NTW74_11865, partial [Acidobacteria bacterium]|nr:hypothetical protein [Acidobacteriota bacterium]
MKILALGLFGILLSAKQPQLAVQGDTTWMAYGEGNKIFLKSSTHGAARWSKPVELGEFPKLMLGKRRGPRIAVSGDSVVVSAIADGELLSWRNGVGPVKVNDVPTSAREGLHAMAAGGGKIYIAWLDLRVKGMHLYGSVSSDGGKTCSKNELLYEGEICECCHPSVIVDDAGKATVMFRNHVGAYRDMYMAPWGGKAVKLGKGSWELNACPMDGGSFVWEAPGKLLTAWRRDKQVFTARPGEAETLLGTGRQPVLVRGGWAAWTEGNTLWLKQPDGSTRKISEMASFVSAVERPGGGVLLAWDGANEIETYDVIPPMPLPNAPSRSEILKTLEREMYGKAPSKPAKQGFELREKSDDALGGT